MTDEQVAREIARLQDRVRELERQLREKQWERYTDAELRHHVRIEH
jgi:uncharacterized protein with PhoU and TrkA domain